MGNSPHAINKSFEHGFGTELDIRDQEERIVLSHDIPGDGCIDLQDAIDCWKKKNKPGYLAIDVKACGLASKVEKIITRNDGYFFFGMPLPDMLEYREKQLPFFTRVSEYEMEPLLYSDAEGVWLDLFYSDDDMLTQIEKHLKNNKKVCIVSAELNGRSYENQWKMLRDYGLAESDSLILCTDYSEKAREYFKESRKNESI